MEDEHKHFVGKIAHKAIIVKDNKVLLVRSDKGGHWDIPGGRIHVGERPNDALKREVKEELGLDITPGAPFFADLIRATLSPEVRYFIAFHAVLDDPNQQPSFNTDEVSEVMWLSKDDLETVNTFEVCREALRAHFAGTNS